MTTHDTDAYVRRFYELYKSNLRSTGRFNTADGKVVTSYDPPSPMMVAQHLRGQVGLGLVPITDDDTCHWGAIDMDNHGQSEDLPIVKVEKMARERAMPLVLCRSKSGGIHAYIFAKEPMPARRMKYWLARFAEDLGFKGCEVFPKQASLSTGKDGKKQFGNWINLPYMGGDETVRYALHEGRKLSLEEFVDLAEASRVTLKQLDQRLLLDNPEAPPCIQRMMVEGVGQGQRNEALYNVTVYFRKRFPEDFESKALDANLTMFTKPLGRQESDRTIKSAGRPDYFYRCSEEPIRSLCNREECIKRKFGVTPEAAERIEKISGLPVFSSLVKYTSEPVKWELMVDDKVVTNLSTEELMDWRFMRRAVAERLLKLMPVIKPEEWDRVLMPLLSDVRIVVPPEEASTTGLMREKLKDFAQKADLANRGEDTNDRKALRRGMPVVVRLDGVRCVVFRGQDFVAYLKRNRTDEMKGINLWFAVRELGVINTKLRVADGTINVWHVPIDYLFPPDEPQPDKVEHITVNTAF